ncbi:class I SAM-dependent methyltransferase [Mycolicibacterium sp. 22603]|uniref:class I SAM-dependent methyltransferase n=1 Tax=Mycolicibacterium sp. 22603 TaxID=3453950 RepID=UPI003F82B81E
MPSDEALTDYYSGYTSESEVVLVDGPGSKRPRLRRAYHWLSGDVDPRDFVHVPAGARVLDYGSGGGTYLSYFHSRGVDIVGAEISDVMIEACSKAGLKMRRVQSYDDIPFPDAQFDVVYLMQVFEHLRNPRRFMKELARVLRTGGVLYLALPNADSAWRRIFGANWVSGWFAPFHLVHYTRQSLARLAAEHGLSVTSSWSRTPESWFRLNLKAALYRDDHRVETYRPLVDSLPSRLVLMCVLRLADVFLRERDCLVVSFRKEASEQRLTPR